jgi:NAD(P)H-dependent FMN reductase
MALEASRILHHLGCDVRVFDPAGLPVKDDVQHQHEKVQELRNLSEWSDAQFWSSPEQHGNITAVMKNQSELEVGEGDVRKADIVDVRSHFSQSTGYHSRLARCDPLRVERWHSPR